MTAYYNEIDPNAAEWLRELIKAGMITDGEVDERSIEDVLPADVRRFDRCHFFAGIGAWDYALNLAGWEGQVWTGSCPCQPFSTAGKRGGFADERHLWPAWFHLIEVCRPNTVFGEQVASKDGLTWLDLVSADVEGIGYTIGAIDLPAAGVGAPHKRQRFFFGVGQADTDSNEPRGRCRETGGAGEEIRIRTSVDVTDGGEPCNVANPRCGSVRNGRPAMAGTQGGGQGKRNQRQRIRPDVGNGSKSDGLAIASTLGRRGRGDGDSTGNCGQVQVEGRGPANGFWRDAEWLYCRDEKYRATKPGIFPLADGVPGRVGLLRGAGNAISPGAAKAFIESWKEVQVVRFRAGVDSAV